MYLEFAIQIYSWERLRRWSAAPFISRMGILFKNFIKGRNIHRNVTKLYEHCNRNTGRQQCKWLIKADWFEFKDFPTDGKDSRAGQSVSDRRPSGQLINGCFSRGWSIGLFRMCNFSYLAVIGGKSNQEKANNLARVRRTLKIIFWAVQLILVV